MTCNDVSSNPSTEAPQLTIIPQMKHDTKKNHLPIILGATGGALFMLLLVTVSVLLYVRRRNTEVRHTSSKENNQIVI